MRVSLPGYDALTDTTIDHYSIYADSDNVLIKEYFRGTLNVNNFAFGTITHELGYIPESFVYANNNGTSIYLTGGVLSASYNTYYSIGTGNLIIYNNLGTATTFHYQIMYDKGTALFT
jgi:hypothetical protein